jgi:hypothetical protein
MTEKFALSEVELQKEFKAMNECFVALRDLNFGTRRRVLVWLRTWINAEQGSDETY